MSDDNWLQAMTRHAGQRTDFATLTGGADEQSRVLQESVKQNPVRFAQLALRLTADINPAYGSAILMGLGEAAPIEDPDVVFEAVRHIASLGQEENDRWLGSSLRPYLKVVPSDLVQLISDRAATAIDPSDDGMRIRSQDRDRRAADVRVSGINTARGSLADALANLLVYDLDGSKTQRSRSGRAQRGLLLLLCALPDRRQRRRSGG